MTVHEAPGNFSICCASPAVALNLSNRMNARRLLVSGLALVGFLAPLDASAQSRTFHLDRLDVAGGPDDGVVLVRPKFRKTPNLFAQVGMGYMLNPLKTSTLTADAITLRGSGRGVIEHQVTTTLTFGAQLWDRWQFALTLPFSPYQAGANPAYPQDNDFFTAQSSVVTTSGGWVGDLRADARVLAWRSEDENAAVATQLSIFAPTGNGTTSSFGGDGQVTATALVSGEYKMGDVSVVANTGVNLRPAVRLNDPRKNNGVGVGNEWRWALGAFLPVPAWNLRAGVTIFGQTGLESDDPVVGKTLFTARNSPVEWLAEGRFRFGEKSSWWAGPSVGTMILGGYGAPDFRMTAVIGYRETLGDDLSDLERRRLEEEAARKRRPRIDTDKDGIFDDVDACVLEAEDGEPPDPTDGCPKPKDSDGDGIVDILDKCPTQAEDKDGIEDFDGCPESDYDGDGIEDDDDACPEEPGVQAANPDDNGCPRFIRLEGKQIRILQQVQFKTASADILPVSFPILEEVASVLKIHTRIGRISIEGHTDNRGKPETNRKLSDSRAHSVERWLAQHGVEAVRLEAHGYGQDRPIASNNDDGGRARNRRVEFHILEQAVPTPSGSSGTTGKAPTQPTDTPAPEAKPVQPSAPVPVPTTKKTNEFEFD